jgi:hypothetical protein
VPQLDALALKSSRSGKRSNNNLDRNLQKVFGHVVGGRTTEDIPTAVVALFLGSF